MGRGPADGKRRRILGPIEPSVGFQWSTKVASDRSKSNFCSMCRQAYGGPFRMTLEPGSFFKGRRIRGRRLHRPRSTPRCVVPGFRTASTGRCRKSRMSLTLRIVVASAHPSLVPPIQRGQEGERACRSKGFDPSEWDPETLSTPKPQPGGQEESHGFPLDGIQVGSARFNHEQPTTQSTHHQDHQHGPGIVEEQLCIPQSEEYIGRLQKRTQPPCPS